MWTLIKKYWLLLLIGVCVIVLGIGYFTGSNSKAYNMMLDTLRSDQSKVVQVLESQLSNSEKDVAALQAERAKLQKDKAELQLRADQSAARVTQLNGEILALKKQYEGYTPPADPDNVIKHINSLGIKSIIKR